MIPLLLKSLIKRYCTGVEPTDEQMDEIMALVEKTNADPVELSDFMEQLITGPTKEELEKQAKAAKAVDTKAALAEMETLISAALADGVLTDKERKVLNKRAAEAGIDLDEFEVILDARIHEAQKAQQPKEKPADKKPTTPKPEKPVAEKASTAAITIRPDMDCYMLMDGEFYETMFEANKMTKVQLPAGQHIVEFFHIDYPEIKMEMEDINWKEGKSYILPVKGLKDMIESTLQAAKQAEAEAKAKAEAEAKAKAEAEAKEKARNQITYTLQITAIKNPLQAMMVARTAFGWDVATYRERTKTLPAVVIKSEKKQDVETLFAKIDSAIFTVEKSAQNGLGEKVDFDAKPQLVVPKEEPKKEDEGTKLYRQIKEQIEKLSTKSFILGLGEDEGLEASNVIFDDRDLFEQSMYDFIPESRLYYIGGEYGQDHFAFVDGISLEDGELKFHIIKGTEDDNGTNYTDTDILSMDEINDEYSNLQDFNTLSMLRIWDELLRGEWFGEHLDWHVSDGSKNESLKKEEPITTSKFRDSADGAINNAAVYVSYTSEEGEDCAYLYIVSDRKLYWVDENYNIAEPLEEKLMNSYIEDCKRGDYEEWDETIDAYDSIEDFLEAVGEAKKEAVEDEGECMSENGEYVVTLFVGDKKVCEKVVR